MRSLPALFAAVLLSIVPGVRGQTTEADLTARLVDKPLMLRGLWGSDKLKFDGTGKPEGKYEVAPFTVCGIDVQSVALRGDRLRIDGQRVALAFDRDGAIRRLPLTEGKFSEHKPERITVELHGANGQDFGPALDAVFVDSLAPLVPAMPDFWQKYATGHFHPVPGDAAPEAGERTKPQPAAPGAAHVGGSVTAPRVLHQQDAAFSEEARQLKYSGNVQVYLWVDEAGMPSHIRVVRPAGAGLDEQAVRAVSTYRFKPATKDGQPVKVDLYIDVNFQIF